MAFDAGHRHADPARRADARACATRSTSQRQTPDLNLLPAADVPVRRRGRPVPARRRRRARPRSSGSPTSSAEGNGAPYERALGDRGVPRRALPAGRRRAERARVPEPGVLPLRAAPRRRAAGHVGAVRRVVRRAGPADRACRAGWWSASDAPAGGGPVTGARRARLAGGALRRPRLGGVRPAAAAGHRARAGRGARRAPSPRTPTPPPSRRRSRRWTRRRRRWPAPAVAPPTGGTAPVDDRGVRHRPGRRAARWRSRSRSCWRRRAAAPPAAPATGSPGRGWRSSTRCGWPAGRRRAHLAATEVAAHAAAAAAAADGRRGPAAAAAVDDLADAVNAARSPRAATAGDARPRLPGDRLHRRPARGPAVVAPSAVDRPPGTAALAAEAVCAG